MRPSIFLKKADKAFQPAQPQTPLSAQVSSLYALRCMSNRQAKRRIEASTSENARDEIHSGGSPLATNVDGPIHRIPRRHVVSCSVMDEATSEYSTALASARTTKTMIDIGNPPANVSSSSSCCVCAIRIPVLEKNVRACMIAVHLDVVDDIVISFSLHDALYN